MDNKWHSYDDTVVTQVNISQIKKEDAYILFYIKNAPLELPSKENNQDERKDIDQNEIVTEKVDFVATQKEDDEQAEKSNTSPTIRRSKRSCHPNTKYTSDSAERNKPKNKKATRAEKVANQSTVMKADLLCYCQTEYVEGEEMLQCSGAQCEEWFHPKCIEYFCTKCKSDDNERLQRQKDEITQLKNSCKATKSAKEGDANELEILKKKIETMEKDRKKMEQKMIDSKESMQKNLNRKMQK
jgi:hypothetical protein